jgi:L-fucose mutarotase
MLKHIDTLLNSELLFALDKMGHGDRLAIVDANFPSYSHCNYTHISLAGVDATTVLSSLLRHFPLDAFTDSPFNIMAQDDSSELTESALDFIRVQAESEESNHRYRLIDRQEFYQITRECQVVIRTKDCRPYACMILQKGVIF